MAKKKGAKPQREVTKRQLSQWQRQRRRQRLIQGVGISIIAAIVVVVGVGAYLTELKPMHQTVITVNDTDFNMKYYMDTLEAWGEEQSPEYIRSIANAIIEEIERNELIRQEALKLGISISDDEIKQELKTAGLPDDDIHRDLVRGQLLINSLRDEYFEFQVPRHAEQRHILALLLESEQQAAEVAARLESSENLTRLAGELSLHALVDDNSGDFGWHTESILTKLLGSPIPVEYAFGSEAGALSPPLPDGEIIKGAGYWLIKVLNRGEDDEADVRAMLLGSEAEAQGVIARLEAGEDFGALARELSQLGMADENEGVLGTMAPEQMTPAFDAFVFNQDIAPGTLSEPIRDDEVLTEGGHWLIKVLGADDNRLIDESDRDWLKGQAMSEWVSSLWDDPGNVIDHRYLTDEKQSWAVEQVIEKYRAG